MCWYYLLYVFVIIKLQDQELEDLKPALDLMIQLRGRELKLKTCEELVRDHLNDSLQNNQ